MWGGTPDQYIALRNEVQADPRSYGYATPLAAQNYEAVAALVNTVRTAANGGPNGGAGTAITIRRGIRSGIEVMNCIDITEFAALVVGRQQWILALVTPIEGVDLSNDVVRANLGSTFAAGATRSRLIAAADKTPASRAEELFGIGSAVGGGNVFDALQWGIG